MLLNTTLGKTMFIILLLLSSISLKFYLQGIILKTKLRKKWINFLSNLQTIALLLHAYSELFKFFDIYTNCELNDTVGSIFLILKCKYIYFWYLHFIMFIFINLLFTTAHDTIFDYEHFIANCDSIITQFCLLLRYTSRVVSQ